MQYKNVGLPKILWDRFWEVAHYFGYRSWAEFVVETTRARIREMENIASLREMEKKDEM